MSDEVLGAFAVLVFGGPLVAWVLVWRYVAAHRISNGVHFVVAHLTGVLYAMGVAGGVFLMGLACLIPLRGDESSIELGTGGAIALGLALGAIRWQRAIDSRRREAAGAPRKSIKELMEDAWSEERRRQQASKVRAEMARAERRAETDSVAGVQHQTVPRQSFKEALKDGGLEARRRKQESRLLAETACAEREVRCAAREKALGMSFGDFLLARGESHFMFWLVVSFVVAGFMTDFIPLLLVIAVWVALCAVLPLLAFPVLVVLPLVWLSVWLEARWRICHHVPYVEPPVTISHEHYVSPSFPSQPPRSRSGSWLVPLALGLWIGSWWGDDD